jgi:hypothetical protein
VAWLVEHEVRHQQAAAHGEQHQPGKAEPTAEPSRCARGKYSAEPEQQPQAAAQADTEPPAPITLARRVSESRHHKSPLRSSQSRTTWRITLAISSSSATPSS